LTRARAARGGPAKSPTFEEQRPEPCGSVVRCIPDRGVRRMSLRHGARPFAVQPMASCVDRLKSAATLVPCQRRQCGCHCEARQRSRNGGTEASTDPSVHIILPVLAKLFRQPRPPAGVPKECERLVRLQTALTDDGAANRLPEPARSRRDWRPDCLVPPVCPEGNWRSFSPRGKRSRGVLAGRAEMNMRAKSALPG
jgi:hypothetical protein